MATYELIKSVSVGSGGAASLDFVGVGSIPTEYTDLVIVLSSRSERAGQALDTLELSLNGSTANRFTHRLYGDGSSVAGDGFTNGRIGLIDAATALANTFSSTVIYLPNVQKSVNKTALIQNVSEDQTVGSYQEYFAFIWKDNAALTSISLSATNGNLAEHTYASLYGVRNVNNAAAPKATGGIISYDATNDYWVHTFTASGTFTPTEDMTCEYLVVAGGGGGGGALSANAGFGAGGAGGYRCSVSGESSGGGASAETPLSLTASTGYTVTIGAGGAGGAAGNNNNGVKGSDSTLHTITSEGGGYGSSTTAGGSGGSGGGGRYNSVGGSGATDQGFKGGDNTPSPTFGGASGGGAGAAGVKGSGDFGAAGGIGVQSSITGTAIYRAGGGGGGSHGTSATGGNGGLGGGGRGQSNGLPAASGLPSYGGGGGSANGTLAGAGASGGSGVVIVRYAA